MAFPVTSILDDFNRANEGPPPSADWARVSAVAANNTMVVVSNQMESTATAVTAFYWDTETFGPDSEVFIKIVAKGAGLTSGRLYIRLNSPTSAGSVSGYMAVASFSGNSIQVYRIDPGPSNTALGAGISQTITNGDSFGLAMENDQITVWYKVGAGAWNSIGTRTDSTYSGAGYVGVAIDQGDPNAVKLDDFGGGNMAVIPDPTFRIQTFRPRVFAPGTPR